MTSALTVSHIAVLVAAALLLIFAAINDARYYKIPNAVSLGLMALFPVFVLTALRTIEWDQHVMVFGLVLISGFIMFIGHLAGAGDIKLLAATSLWAGPHLVAVFLIITAIAGGLLALIMAVLTYARNASGKHATIAFAKVPIPYGIAIATGGLSTIYMLSQPLLFPS
ncbi:MAG: prepilin peptidase [Pseudomonadota bacterium]|nr:prepilin peptidase [Pseudomonadota bacterium]